VAAVAGEGRARDGEAALVELALPTRSRITGALLRAVPAAAGGGGGVRALLSLPGALLLFNRVPATGVADTQATLHNAVVILKLLR
jgi:hypothetical protein